MRARWQPSPTAGSMPSCSRWKPTTRFARPTIKEFRIKPRSDGTFRGYERKDFEDAWSRYLPCDPPANPPTRPDPNEFMGLLDAQPVSHENAADGLRAQLLPHLQVVLTG